MSLEVDVLEILAKHNSNPADISEEIGVKRETVEDVLRRLKSAGLLIEQGGR